MCLTKILRSRILCECIDLNCAHFRVKTYKIKYKRKFVPFSYDRFGLRLFSCGILKMSNFWLNCKIYCNRVLLYLSAIGNGKSIAIPVSPSNAARSTSFHDFPKRRAGSWCNNKFSWSSSATTASYPWLSNWISAFSDRERTNAFGKPRRQCSRERLPSKHEPTHRNGDTKRSKPLRNLRIGRNGRRG